MSSKLTQLPQTSFSGLEFDNIMVDIHNLIKDNPDYNANWDDFLNSNAGRILTELFAWIGDQLATRIDGRVNENFIGTAKERSSFIKMLKLIGYKFSLPVAATIPVTIDFSRNIGEYTLTNTYTDGSGVFTPKRVVGRDKSGNTRTFEALSYDTGTQRYSYKVPVETNTNLGLKRKVNFYEGETKLKTFMSTDNSGQKFIIEDAPLIRGSIAVYMLVREGVSIQEVELLEVDNFLAAKAQKANDQDGSNAIPYIIHVREDDSVELEFGPLTLLPTPDRRLPNGIELRVFYRVGGGNNGNISTRSIQKTEAITVDGGEVVLNFYNEQGGIGGMDSETVEHASYYGPLKLRTSGKAVTPEDYDIILGDNTNILLSKSYGYNNIPSNYFEKYGTYFNPLDVMSFVVLKKPGYDTISPSKYYLADFGSFNLENRFNGVYGFTDGNYGLPLVYKDKEINLTDIYDYDNQGGRVFKNFVVIETPTAFKTDLFTEDEDAPTGYLANADLKGSITKTPYDKTINTKIEEISDHFVYDIADPFLYGDYNDTAFPRTEIREDINAYFRSTKSILTGLNISMGNNKFTINIDNQGDVIVDLSQGGVSPAMVPIDTVETPYVKGVVDIINDAISGSYGIINAYQDFGILITDIEAQVENLENRDEEDWILKISDLSYTINTGVDQSYTQMLVQINNVLNPHKFLATFVQNRVNITCFDIRIQRTVETGTVVLQNSNTAYDILEAFEATPLTTTPVSSGDYSLVASKVVDDDGSYILLTSPNKGSASTIKLKPSIDPSKSALQTLFGLDVESDNVADYTCYGQKALTIIFRDPAEPDFGDFIYEHGTINFSPEDADVLYLNYINSKTNRINLGHYFNTAYTIEDPEWKEVDNRIYNTQYILDVTDADRKRELFSLDSSKIYLKYTRDEYRGNSIFKIDNDLQIKETDYPVLVSKNLFNFPDLTGKLLTMKINENTERSIDLSLVTSAPSLVERLNVFFNDEANESTDVDITFAKLEITATSALITITTDNKTTGSIKIIGEPGSACNLIWSELPLETSSYTVFPTGDFYFEYNEALDSIDLIKIDTSENIPDSPFYIHYVADRRHEFIDPERLKIHTDEDDLISYMSSMKIAGVNNLFKRPVFTTFDIKADVFCSNAVPKEQIKLNVENALNSQYSLTGAEFNKPVVKSEVSKIMMDVPGVRYVELRYFGVDMTNGDSNEENRVVSGFDEIITISEDVFDSSGKQQHGKNLTFNII